MSNDLLSKVIINTVAASDARMGGAPVVAMSNFGSGNQGITATMPVVVVAEHLGVDEETGSRFVSLSSHCHLNSFSLYALICAMRSLNRRYGRRRRYGLAVYPRYQHH